MASSAVIGIDASRAVTSLKTGTEHYTLQLLDALRRLDPSEEFRLYLNSTAAPDDLPALGTPVCIPFPRLWTHARLSLELTLHRPDLLFVPAHVIPLLHPRSVVTIHDLGYAVHPESHPASDRRMLDLTTRWSVRAAKRVIAISAQTKADLVAHYRTDPHKIDVVHHGVSKRFSPASTDEIRRVRAAYSLPERFVLAVGTVQPRKNYGRLSRAIASLGGPPLVIAGKPGWMSDQVQREIADSGADVRQIGYVPDADLPALYSAAALFCQPSLYEGFGMPVLEAMACGVPVVAARASSLPEIGSDAAVYADPLDVGAIATSLSDVLSSDQRRTQMRAAGIARAAGFTWERTARETMSVLRAALTGV